jgi:uncharacterized protein YjdB
MRSKSIAPEKPPRGKRTPLTNGRGAFGVRRALAAATLGAAVAGAALTACGEKPSGLPSSDPNDTIATITLAPDNPLLPQGSTLELIASLADSAGQPLTPTGRTIEWASSRPDIASVNTLGAVTALELGTATITATSERKIGSTVVTVVDAAVAEVDVSPPTAEMSPFGNVQLTATVKASDGRVLTGRFVIWSSSAPSVMSVNESGFVTAMLASGTATISAQVDGAVGFATVVIR